MKGEGKLDKVNGGKTEIEEEGVLQQQTQPQLQSQQQQLSITEFFPTMVITAGGTVDEVMANPDGEQNDLNEGVNSKVKNKPGTDGLSNKIEAPYKGQTGPTWLQVSPNAISPNPECVPGEGLINNDNINRKILGLPTQTPSIKAIGHHYPAKPLQAQALDNLDTSTLIEEATGGNGV